MTGMELSPSTAGRLATAIRNRFSRILQTDFRGDLHSLHLSGQCRPIVPGLCPLIGALDTPSRCLKQGLWILRNDVDTAFATFDFGVFRPKDEKFAPNSVLENEKTGTACR